MVCPTGPLAREGGRPTLEPWLIVVLYVAGSILAGWILGSQWQAMVNRRLAQARDRERQEAEQALSRLRREIVEHGVRAQEYAQTFSLLPETLRDLFQARSPRATIAPLVRIVEVLLEPEQLAFFAARPGQKRLALAQGTGLPPNLPPGFEVEYGQGRVGYVAVHRLCMDEATFRGAREKGDKGDKGAETARPATPEIKGLRSELVAPVSEGESLFGVISVSGVRQRRGLEKRLLMMVADLAAVALTNAERARAADEGTGLDGMTGLLNRRRLLERLDQETLKAEHDGTALGVLMLDIDHFRHYNETNGHMQGDELLRQMAGLLRTSVRADDIVARYAGEEFVVVYPGADKETAVRLAEQLRAAVEAYPFPFRGLQPKGAVTVSGGVACYPRDSKVGRELIRCADQALADAKGAGRNQISAAAPSYLA